MSRGNSLVDEQLTDSTYYILLSLLKPMHGYGIMQYIENLSEGEFTIGPVTLYTIIKKLINADFIVQTGENGNRKIYSLTPKGKNIIINEINRREKLVKHGIKALQRIKKLHN